MIFLSEISQSHKDQYLLYLEFIRKIKRHESKKETFRDVEGERGKKGYKK
jgi:hypothetical protein